MIRSLIVTLTLIGSQVAPACAQNAMPALRANVTVNSDTVRIGDLVEHAGAVANVPIFRAPDLGTRGTVTTASIVDAIRPHQLVGIDTRGLAEVIVTRATRTITAKEISGRVAHALAGQYGFEEASDILVEFDRDARPLFVEPSATGDLQVLSLSYNKRTSRFDVTFDLPTSAALPRQGSRFTGVAYETVNAVAVEHPVEHGEVLKASDLTMLRRPKSEGTVITSVQAAIGFAAKHELRPGQPLRNTDLMKPYIVQRNDAVTIVYEAPGFTLTLRGQAQDNGALGDTINVLNLQSKRVVQGVISGAGRITIASTPIHSVQRAPEPAPASPARSPEQPENGHSVE